MKRLTILAALLVTPAFAQQPSLTDVQMQRNNFMSAFAQCDSLSIALQQQFSEMQRKLSEAEAKLKTLEKPEPAK